MLPKQQKNAKFIWKIRLDDLQIHIQMLQNVSFMRLSRRRHSVTCHFIELETYRLMTEFLTHAHSFF